MKDHLGENSFILIEGLFLVLHFYMLSKPKLKKAMMNDMAENERKLKGNEEFLISYGEKRKTWGSEERAEHLVRREKADHVHSWFPCDLCQLMGCGENRSQARKSSGRTLFA